MTEVCDSVCLVLQDYSALDGIFLTSSSLFPSIADKVQWRKELLEQLSSDEDCDFYYIVQSNLVV